jgi:hypothetical protein
MIDAGGPVMPVSRISAPHTSGDVSVASKSQRKSTGGRRPAKGLVRIEIEAPEVDTALLQAVAETLRGDPRKAAALRSTLEEVLVGQEVKTAFDIFGTDLPDEVFADVFDQPRQRTWRRADL